MTGFAAKAKSAVIWNTGFNLFRDLLQFGTMLVLVRILEPKSYGEFTMVSSVMAMLAIFSHNNFMAYLLQVRNDHDAHYQEHFTASGMIQSGIFIITNLVAIGMRWFPDYAPIAPYIHVMSMTFMLEWPCELRRKMLERNFDWKTLRLLHATGLIAAAVLAIVMAKSGAGAYALFVPGMVSTLPFTIDLFFIRKWRPSWSWSWEQYRPAFLFGVARIGSGLLMGGKALLESSVIVSLLGYSTLGFYGRAAGLSQMFCQKFASQLLYAVYPVLTRLDSTNGSEARASGLVLRLVAWISIPMAMLFSALAMPIVHVLFGSKWTDVTSLLPAVMTLGALLAVSSTAYTLLLSKHEVKKCLQYDTGILIGTAVLLVFILGHGLFEYLCAQAVMQVMALGILLAWLSGRNLVTPKGIVDALLPPVLAGGIALVATRLLLDKLQPDAIPLVTISVSAVFFCLAYLLGLRLAFKPAMADIAEHLPGRDLVATIFRLEP